MSRIPAWLIFSALAGLCWAVWAILAKAAEGARLTVYQTQVLFTAGLLPPTLLALRRRHFRRGAFTAGGLAWGALAGLLGALGNLGFYAALGRGGKASIVVPLTALYPLVTVAVAWLFMKELLTRAQVVGAGAAVIAIVLLSGEAEGLARPAWLAGASILAPWMLYAIAALGAWGLLSAAQKLSTNTVTPELSLAAFTAAFLPVAAVLMVIAPDEAGPAALSRLGTRGLALAVVAGAMNGLGMLASFVAYRSEGKASLVTPLAGMLSSVFTVALAMVFLGETLGIFAAAGIGIATLSAVMLSWEPKAVRSAAPAPGSATP